MELLNRDAGNCRLWKAHEEGGRIVLEDPVEFNANPAVINGDGPVDEISIGRRFNGSLAMFALPGSWDSQA